MLEGKKVVCIMKMGVPVPTNLDRRGLKTKTLYTLERGERTVARVLDPGIKADFFNAHRIAKEAGGRLARNAVLGDFVAGRISGDFQRSRVYWAGDVVATPFEGESFKKGVDFVDKMRGIRVPAEYLARINEEVLKGDGKGIFEGQPSILLYPETLDRGMQLLNVHPVFDITFGLEPKIMHLQVGHSTIPQSSTGFPGTVRADEGDDRVFVGGLVGGVNLIARQFGTLRDHTEIISKFGPGRGLRVLIEEPKFAEIR